MAKENKSVKNFPNSRSIPKLRFPEFNDEWENKKLGDLMTFKVTNSYSRDNLNYESGTVKNIHYGDIHTKFQTLFDLEKENVPYVNEDISLNRISEDFYCQEGDVIFADASEDLNDVGKSIEITNLNGEKLLSGLHTLLARPQKNNFSKGFLGYLLKSDFVRNQIKKESQGSKVLSINVGRISNIHLSFPSISEQQKISEFLSLLDKRILCSMKIIEQLKTLMKASREKIFSKKLRFKNENNDFYSEWKSTKLKNISQIFDGTHQTPKYVKKGVPFYSVENLTANNFSVTKYISEEVFIKENNRVKIEKGDILMTRIGDIGTVKYIDWNVNASFYVSLALIKSNNDNNSKYLAQYISSDKFQNELWNRTIHVAFPKKINLGEIGECLLKIPCIEEQTKIANFLSSIQEKIETEKQILEKLEQQKKFLMANLFV
ncbi:restriction endonuclease subunit S [Cloacibacterium normanense]|uniref:Restriction endonuclease subunit S n=1 Tax=Cloacibacterium normanense TaxID=237258 RepID=A0A2S7I400_9FLAO|nr:restriction endonuclease subunit S [Cloacibacterium normanense]PPZ91312.1 restriction endonuclease subunit S [Cloacibacterium normanense]